MPFTTVDVLRAEEDDDDDDGGDDDDEAGAVPLPPLLLLLVAASKKRSITIVLPAVVADSVHDVEGRVRERGVERDGERDSSSRRGGAYQCLRLRGRMHLEGQWEE